MLLLLLTLMLLLISLLLLSEIDARAKPRLVDKDMALGTFTAALSSQPMRTEMGSKPRLAGGELKAKVKQPNISRTVSSICKKRANHTTN